MVLAPVVCIHNCVAESSIFVDDVKCLVADGILPDLKAKLDGYSCKQDALALIDADTRMCLLVDESPRKSICLLFRMRNMCFEAIAYLDSLASDVPSSNPPWTCV
jgi:hypothetical protein